jgi:hypothetical protein
MFELRKKKYADYLRGQPETGMGYWIATVHLKDGRVFRQVLIEAGYVIEVRGQVGVPFTEADIDHVVVTHEKWKD